MTFNSSSPPPSPRWWLTREGKPEGPFEQSLILGWIQEGRLESSSIACPDGGQQWKPLSSWPQFAVSISQTVNASDQSPASARETQTPQMEAEGDVSQKVAAPAIGLIFTGGLTILSGTLFLPDIFFPVTEYPVDVLISLLLMVYSLLFGAITLFGAIKMCKIESYKMSTIAAITAMLPWYCCILC